MVFRMWQDGFLRYNISSTNTGKRVCCVDIHVYTDIFFTTPEQQTLYKTCESLAPFAYPYRHRDMYHAYAFCYHSLRS